PWTAVWKSTGRPWRRCPRGPSANGSSPWTKRSTTTDERPGGSGLRRDLRGGEGAGRRPGPAGPCPPPGAGDRSPAPDGEGAGGQAFLPGPAPGPLQPKPQPRRGGLRRPRPGGGGGRGAPAARPPPPGGGDDRRGIFPPVDRPGGYGQAGGAGTGVSPGPGGPGRCLPQAGRSPARVSCGGLPGGGG